MVRHLSSCAFPDAALYTLQYIHCSFGQLYNRLALCSSWIVKPVWVQYMSHTHSIFKLVHEPGRHQLNICAISNSTFLINSQAWHLTKTVIPPTWCVGVLTSLSPTPNQMKNERKACQHICKSKALYLCCIFEWVWSIKQDCLKHMHAWST